MSQFLDMRYCAAQVGQSVDVQCTGCPSKLRFKLPPIQKVTAGGHGAAGGSRTEAELAGLSVSRLRTLASQRGVSVAGLLEKSELVAAVCKA